MKAKVGLDTRGFAGMCRELASFAGHGGNTEPALRGEVGAVLSICAKRTKVGKKAKTRKRADVEGRSKANKEAEQFALDPHEFTYLNSRKDVGRPWLVVRHGGKRQFIFADKAGASGARWSWGRKKIAEINAMVSRHRAVARDKARAQITRAMAALGATAASWVQIGKSLGINVEAAGVVSRHAGGVRGRIDGKGTRGAPADGIYFIVTNANRILTSSARINGVAILNGAIRTRLNAFKNNLKHGVFQDVKARAERYPGIFVKE